MQIKALVLVGSVAITALPVAAQAAEPYPPYGLPRMGAAPTAPLHVGVLPPFEIETVVRSMGLQLLAPPMRRPRVYVVHAIDARGVEHRVVVDARFGHVLRVGPVIADRYFDGPRYAPMPAYPRYGALAPRGYGQPGIDVDVDVDVDVDIDLDRRPLPPVGVAPRPYDPRHAAPPPRPAKPAAAPAPKSARADPAAMPTPRPRPAAADARAEQTAPAPSGPIRKIEIKKPEAARPQAETAKPGAVSVPVAPLL